MATATADSATTPKGAPHAHEAREVVRSLGTDSVRGLHERDACLRLAAGGANRLEEVPPLRYGTMALRQLVDPLVGLLAVAAIVSFAIGERLEAIAIATIVVLNATFGFFQEASAESAMMSLRVGMPRRARVVRDGRQRDLDAEDLVPGDVFVLREGDAVPADARLLDAHGVEVDESTLTGESMPVEKGVAAVRADTPLAERRPMVFAGTGLTRGRARAVVTATGGATQLGVIAQLTERRSSPPTPLQARLGRLAGALAALGVGLTLVLGGALLARGASFHEAFLTGVAVAVAAVPEGLLATVTVALGLGARAMADRGAIVRRLVSIETIGATTLACVDKTGTLTENRMSLAAIRPAPDRSAVDVLTSAWLASAAEIVEEEGAVRITGDPVEEAIFRGAMERGIPSSVLEERIPLSELAFSPERRRMSVTYDQPDGRWLFAKGAPEVVLALCVVESSIRLELESAAQAWAEEGFRVLAVAERRLPDGELSDGESDLTPVGLVALHDPLRSGVHDSIGTAREAGIRVSMLTGDHPATAHAIGRALDLPDHEVFARVTPADKLAIVEAAQADGEVVLVTGDGVNDAPALRQADVGVAMGRSGTASAREASDIILVDDAFETIVAAIREGRRIGDNVRKVIAFLLSANLGEVVLFGIAVGVGLGAPMAVVQVLAVNVLTDGLPALALARDPLDPAAMTRPSRGRGPLFPGWLIAGLGGVGVLVGLAGLGAYLIGRETGRDTALTMAFVTVAVAELLFVFACRSERTAAWRLSRNDGLVLTVLASFGILGAVVYAPFLQSPFKTVALDARLLAFAIGFAVVPVLAVELAKTARRARGRCGKGVEPVTAKPQRLSASAPMRPRQRRDRLSMRRRS